MLSENIKRARKAKGLSQEELALKMNVVRQTVSKWENGLSVPDADLLLSLANELDTPVSTLLDENIPAREPEDIQAIAERLAEINLQLARRSMVRIKAIRWGLASLCALIVTLFAALAAMKSAYLDWDYSNPELAAAGTMLHGFEYVFVRLAPVVFFAAVIGIAMTWRNRK